MYNTNSFTIFSRQA